MRAGTAQQMCDVQTDCEPKSRCVWERAVYWQHRKRRRRGEGAAKRLLLPTGEGAALRFLQVEESTALWRLLQVGKTAVLLLSRKEETATLPASQSEGRAAVRHAAHAETAAQRSFRCGETAPPPRLPLEGREKLRWVVREGTAEQR